MKEKRLKIKILRNIQPCIFLIFTQLWCLNISFLWLFWVNLLAVCVFTVSTYTWIHTVPWRYIHLCTIHPPFIDPFTFFRLGVINNPQRVMWKQSTFNSLAAPSGHEPFTGGAQWLSMGELGLGRSVAWSFCGWTYHQGIVHVHAHACIQTLACVYIYIYNYAPSRQFKSV